MSEKKKGISRYRLGEKILIGYRNDDSLFWLRDENNNFNPEDDKLNVVEAGRAWVDEKSNTTVLDFPITDEEKVNQLANEFLRGNDCLNPYIESDYYVQLANCERRLPIQPEHQEIEYIDHDYDLPEDIEGYILNEDTFVRKDTKTEKIFYVKFLKFTMNDFENDRFGWVKAARRYYSCTSDEELLSELEGFRKESYGEAWIDQENDVLVLGTVVEQEPEILDNYFADRIFTYLGTYSIWNQTRYWIDIESGTKNNPFDYKTRYFYALEKYMG